MRLASDLASTKGVLVGRGMGDGSVQRRDSDSSPRKLPRFPHVNGVFRREPVPRLGGSGAGAGGANFAAELNQFGRPCD